MSDKYSIRKDTDAMKPQPPIDYIIDTLITNASINVFYGEPGSKKTYSTLSMAVCVANGKDWLGFKTKQSPVLIIDEESGEKRLSRRLNETIRGLDCDATGRISYICLAGFKLDNEDDAKIIESEIKNTKAKLVIFDALTDIMDGDENSKKDVQPVMSALRKMADNTDSSFIVIHHSNKIGGYRGSSAIKGSSDLMVQVSSDLNDNTINFKTEKNRDGNFLAWSADAVWEDDTFSLNPVYVEKVSEREKHIISYLTEHGASLVSDIVNSSEIFKATQLKKAIYKLAKEKKIYRTNPEDGNLKAIYDLPKKPVANDKQ